MKVNLYVTNFPNAGWNITHFKCRLSVYQQHYAKTTKLNLMKLRFSFMSKVESRKIWCGCRSKSGSRNYHNYYLILQDWASFFHRLTNHQTNLMKLGEQGQRTSSLNSGWCPDHIIRNNKVRGMGTDLTGGRPECSSNIEFRIMITSTYSSLLYLAY